MADPKNNITLFLEAVLTSIQDVENALQQLYRERRIDTAVGTQLDILGKIVGQPRNGLSDDTYRRRVRARVSVNRSDGLIEDILTVADLVINDDVAPELTLRINNIGTAALELYVEGGVLDWTTAMIAVEMLRETVAAGVRLITIWLPQAEASTFSFFDGAGLGLGSTLDAGVGGALASAGT